MPNTPSDRASSSTTSPATDLPEELLNTRVRFWRCLQREHRHVTRHGTTAVCATCGLTSDMTREYSAAVRAHERRQVADQIRQTFREYYPTARDWLAARRLSAFSGPGAVALAIAAWITQSERLSES